MWYVTASHNDLNWRSLAAIQAGAERGGGVLLVTATTIGVPNVIHWAKQLTDVEWVCNDIAEDQMYTNTTTAAERRNRVVRGQPWARARDLARAGMYLPQVASDGAWAGCGFDSEDSNDDDHNLGAGLSLGGVTRCWLCDVSLGETSAELYPTRGTAEAWQRPGRGRAGGLRPRCRRGWHIRGRAVRRTEATSHRAHRNLGHPARNHFTRALRHAGVLCELVQGEASFRCPVGEARRRLAAARPGALPRCLTFKKIVAMDLLEMPVGSEGGLTTNAVCRGTALQ